MANAIMINDGIKVPSGIGVIDLGTLDWNYHAGTLTFWYQIGGDYVSGCEIMCELYRDVRDALTGNMRMTSLVWLELNAIHIRNESYTDPATFKEAMKGVLLFYKRAS